MRGSLSICTRSRTLFRSAASTVTVSGGCDLSGRKEFHSLLRSASPSPFLRPSCRKCEVECRRRRVRYSCYSLYTTATTATTVSLPPLPVWFFPPLPRSSRSHRNKSVFGYCVCVRVSWAIHLARTYYKLYCIVPHLYFVYYYITHESLDLSSLRSVCT